jgi:hypothetical protein
VALSDSTRRRPVTQVVEYAFDKCKVVGSSPARPTALIAEELIT